MSTALQGDFSRSIEAVMAFVSAAVPDDHEIDCDEFAQRVAQIHREFRNLIKLANGRLQTLQVELEQWRARVAKDKDEYSPETESAFIEAHRSWLALATLLLEKADRYRINRSIYLVKPLLLNPFIERKNRVERSLTDWKSLERASGKANNLLAELAQGVVPVRSEKLRELARQAVQQSKESEDVDQWATKLAHGLAAHRD